MTVVFPSFGQQPLSKLAIKFELFHAQNPHVYPVLVGLARDMKRIGAKKGSIAQVFEVARWNISIQTNDPDYRLQNSYRAFYARLIMHQEPDLDKFFNVRSSKADAWLTDWIRRNPPGGNPPPPPIPFPTPGPAPTTPPPSGAENTWDRLQKMKASLKKKLK